MAFTGTHVYIAHHVILLQLNHFDLIVDREGWWFEHSAIVAGLIINRGCKNICRPWLSPFRGWGSLTMVFTAKFVFISAS